MSKQKASMSVRERVMALLGFAICLPTAWWALAGSGLSQEVKEMGLSVQALEGQREQEEVGLANLSRASDREDPIEASEQLLAEAAEELASLRVRLDELRAAFPESPQSASAMVSSLAAEHQVQVVSVGPGDSVSPDSSGIARRLREEWGYGRSVQRLVLRAGTGDLKRFLAGLGNLPSRVTVLRMQMHRASGPDSSGMLEITLDVCL